MLPIAFDPELVRLKMKENGVSQTELAHVAKLPSQSAMSNILKGLRRITAQEAADIYEYLRIRPEPNFETFPVIGIGSAGHWREAVQLPIGQLPVPPRVGGERSFGLEICGDSMDRMIDDGGWVLVDPDKKELRPGSVYLIANGNDEATVKQYQRDPARFVPCSFNDEHKGFLMSEADFHIIGKVVWKGGRMP